MVSEMHERSRAGSETAQEEERVRVEIVEQMLSLRVPINHEPGTLLLLICSKH